MKHPYFPFAAAASLLCLVWTNVSAQSQSTTADSTSPAGTHSPTLATLLQLHADASRRVAMDNPTRAQYAVIAGGLTTYVSEFNLPAFSFHADVSLGELHILTTPIRWTQGWQEDRSRNIRVLPRDEAARRLAEGFSFDQYDPAAISTHCQSVSLGGNRDLKTQDYVVDITTIAGVQQQILIDPQLYLIDEIRLQFVKRRGLIEVIRADVAGTQTPTDAPPRLDVECLGFAPLVAATAADQSRPVASPPVGPPDGRPAVKLKSELQERRVDIVVPQGSWGYGEQALVQLINHARAAQGLSTLTLDPLLTQVARGHSHEMCVLNYFNHHSPTPGLNTPLDRYFDGLRDAGDREPGYAIVSENLYYCSTSAGQYDAAFAHRQLMGSPGHRAVILDPLLTRVGVGSYRDIDGRLWVTEMFVVDSAGR